MLTLVLALAGCDDGGGASTETEALADVGASDGAAQAPDARQQDERSPDEGSPDAAPADAGVVPACAVSFVWDPRTATALETFPDDYYTREDPSTATGLRPYLGPDLAPWLESIPGNYDETYRQVETLDGWGTTAGVILRFSGPVAMPPEGAIRFVGEGTGSPSEVPFEIQSIDDGATLILWPMVPLRPAARHAVVVSRALTAADGGCVAPSTGLVDALAGVAPLDRIGARLNEALEWTGDAADGVVAAAAFTTQTIVDESVAIAGDIAGRPYTWSVPPTCVDAADYRVCDGAFVAQDYRSANGVIAGSTPVVEYELQVRAWVPHGPPSPRPVVVFGHGLGVDRDQAELIAGWVTPLNLITVAIDAPVHGRHPTATPGSAEITQVSDFFGIDIVERRLDALVLRDHFREATYDKLQLIRLLVDAPDLDGDGAADVDPERLAYFGASLGGIMGAELLALSPDVSASLLTVPGARVASIISDGPIFSVIVRAMTPPGTPPSEIARIFPMVQTLIERGDAANYGPHVLRDRLPGAGAAAPQLLVNMAIDDSIVPNVSTRALARALGVPHVPPVLQPVGIVPLASEAPISGNLDDGRTTAGLFQYDRGMREPGGPVERADHDLAVTTEGVLQTTHFLESWATTGLAEIINPYDVLGTPAASTP